MDAEVPESPIEEGRMKRFLLLASLLAASTLYAQEKPSAGLKTRDAVPATATTSNVSSSDTQATREQKLQLPTGSAVKMRLVEAISSDGNKDGDSFSGR